MSVLIKGGRIVTAADDYVGDIYVEDETVTLIGASLDVPADRTIDAAGKYVLPGCVDPHTHLDMPFGGTVTIDDFESGQTAAAFGGTTTHIDFAIQTQGSTFAEALETWHAKREGKSLIDNGFHMIVTDLKEGGTLEELADAARRRGSPRTSSSWPTRACSWSTTRRCSARWRSRRRPARSSWCTRRTATRSTCSCAGRSSRGI